ncbi:Yes-associated protein 1-like protein [Sarcoptes scabiei]|uniref:Yes-associated protein 1-like protein n=1 Tax=Sarcoptes scabiei TaxID=52283 RepID=A0A132A3M6_SARSC|nr:Yes-associated protein 1-like protein [Sarcoptes scabiei]
MANIKPQISSQKQQHPNQMLFVAPNPENRLNELFKVVEDQQSSYANVIPTWRQRNLPDSFFRPPQSSSSSASHSRESSVDASSFANQNSPTKSFQSSQQQKRKPPMAQAQLSNNNKNNNSAANSPGRNHCTSPPGLPIIHQKAHSLPASMSQFKHSPQFPLSSSIIDDGNEKIPNNHEIETINDRANINQNQNGIIGVHNRQQSYDINRIPLPDGWTMSYDLQSGERYFLNHKQKITTWDDPRTKLNNSLNSSLAPLSHSNPIISNHQTHQLQQNPHHHHLHDLHHQANQHLTSSSQTVGVFSSQPNINVDQQLHNRTLMTIDNLGDIGTNQIDHHHLQSQSFLPLMMNFDALRNKSNHSIDSSVAPTSSCSAHNDNSISNKNIPLELVAAMENMNTQPDVSQMNGTETNVYSNQYLLDLEIERKTMRQRQEEICKTATMKSDYVPLQSDSIALTTTTTTSSSTPTNLEEILTNPRMIVAQTPNPSTAINQMNGANFLNGIPK